MSEFFNDYGSLLLLGAFIFLMLRMHSSGGGCCGGGFQREGNPEENDYRGSKDKDSCH